MRACRAVLLLLLACFCRGALSCPALCKCYPRSAEVVCDGVPLTHFPTEHLPENTTMLTIQFTNLSSISEEHLHATPLLSELHLNDNQLQTLSSHLLRGVPHLHILDLTGNKLSHLPVDVFSHAPLRSLVLKNNLIEKADAAWLPDNSNLTWLDLSSNRLTEFPTELLQKLPHLENLDLSRNLLENISANSLDTLTKLERLNLKKNKLSVLDASVFHNTRNLTYLFLSHNKLSELPANIFQELTELNFLSLDHNQLSHIPPGLLDQLRSLDDDGLDLNLNPWRCDRKLEYLRGWMQKNQNKLLLPEIITCRHVSEHPLLSLTEDKLNPES